MLVSKKRLLHWALMSSIAVMASVNVSAKTPLSVQPQSKTIEKFNVSLQTKMMSDDVLHVDIKGRHSTSKNNGLRLQKISLVPQKISADETVYRVQGHYQRIFGKESANYLREGVPFVVKQSIPIKQTSQRYVIEWGEERRTVVRPVPHKGKSAAKF